MVSGLVGGIVGACTVLYILSQVVRAQAVIRQAEEDRARAMANHPAGKKRTHLNPVS